MLDNNHLDGKVTLFAGAGGEIGEATIRLMAAGGARIAAADSSTWRYIHGAVFTVDGGLTVS